jgi:hypothetical protein
MVESFRIGNEDVAGTFDEEKGKQQEKRAYRQPLFSVVYVMVSYF